MSASLSCFTSNTLVDKFKVPRECVCRVKKEVCKLSLEALQQVCWRVWLVKVKIKREWKLISRSLIQWWSWAGSVVSRNEIYSTTYIFQSVCSSPWLTNKVIFWNLPLSRGSPLMKCVVSIYGHILAPPNKRGPPKWAFEEKNLKSYCFCTQNMKKLPFFCLWLDRYLEKVFQGKNSPIGLYSPKHLPRWFRGSHPCAIFYHPYNKEIFDSNVLGPRE